MQYIQLIHAAREYYDEDNEQKALTLLLIALRQHPEKANAYKCIYSWYLSSSRCSSYLDNIITALNNITAEKNYRYYYVRGLSYYLKEELDLALKDYDKLAEIIGEERTVYHHNVIELRALLCIQQYNFEVALGYFTRLVKLDSDNAVALYWCAKINLIFGCNDIALCYFNKLLKCIDDHFDEEMSDNEYIIYFEAIRLHYKLYKLKLNVPDLMNLRERLERIVDINPEFASPYLYLAKVYIKMRNYQLGNDAFMQAIDKDPNFSQTHLTLARLFFKLKNTSAAVLACEQTIKLYNEKIRKYPDDYLLRKRRGDTYSMLFQLFPKDAAHFKECAMKDYDTAHALAPKVKAILEKRARLECQADTKVANSSEIIQTDEIDIANYYLLTL